MGSAIRRRGFTLVELAVVLAVLGVLVVLAVKLIPALTERVRLARTGIDVDRVSEAIAGFSIDNNRLPCPDTDGDGLEGAGAGCVAGVEVGAVPFRSVGLPGPALDQARLPLRYGVYRNAAGSADLAALTELFEPALPDVLTITPGTVTGCNETLATPRTILTYSNPPVTTLRLSGVSGSFAADEFIGFVDVGFSGLTAVVPPAPSSYYMPTPALSNCPCGLSGMACATCPAAFTVGSDVSGDATDDNPVGKVKAVSGSTLTLFPGGDFMPGMTLNQLYVAPFPGTLPFMRTITNPAPPPATVATDNLLTGVSATVTSALNKSARVLTATDLGGGVWELTIDFLEDSAPAFVAGETVYGAGSGSGSGTVVSQTTVQTTFDDTTPEGITGPSGSATIVAGTDTGSVMELSGVTGTFDGPTFDLDAGTSTPGDTITGTLTGTTAEVISLTTSSESVPVVTRGTISFASTVSGQTNRLDFCQSLRNAIAAAGTSGSTSFVHTVNQEAPAVAINPAFLLVSGGVEDADGDGVDGSFDQRNELAPAPKDFESPARLRNDSAVATAAYDDVVLTMQLQRLADELGCARNLGGVNALAVDATVLRNLAEVAFNQNEQALAVIELSYRALEMARSDLAIKGVLVALGAISAAITVYQAIAYPEGAASVLAVAGAAIALVAAIVDLILSVEAEADAKTAYANACTAQTATASALNDARTKATNALNLALRADSLGGVQ